MENITIEKMEIKRFNALLMRTIVGMLFIYLHLQFCCMSL